MRNGLACETVAERLRNGFAFAKRHVEARNGYETNYEVATAHFTIATGSKTLSYERFQKIFSLSVYPFCFDRHFAASAAHHHALEKRMTCFT